MTHRIACLLPLFALVVALGCASTSDDDFPSSETRAAPNGTGVCCPMTTFVGCNPDGVPSGGWAASASECDSHIAAAFDGCPFVRQTDSYGCAELVDPFPNCACACGSSCMSDGD